MPKSHIGTLRWQQISHKTRWDLMAAACLVTAYLALQLQFIAPPPGDDQLNYFKAASELPNVRTSHQEMRLGLLIPVRVLIAIFGPSEIAYYTVPFASAALLSVGTFWLGRILFDRFVGVVAGALVVANPYVLRDSSALLPDVTAAALFTAGLAVMIGAARRHSGDSLKELSRRTWTLLFASGLILGWAYLVREFMPIFFGLVIIVVLIYRLPFRWVLPIATGSFLPFLFEIAWNTAFHGGPLSRLTIAGGHLGDGRADTGPLAVAATFWRELLANDGGLFWIAMASILVLVPLGMFLTRRLVKREPLLLVAWGAGMWVFMTLVGFLPTLLLGEHTTMLRVHKLRYWFPIFPALAIGGIGYATSLLRSRRALAGTVGRAVLVAIVAFSSARGIADLREINVWVSNGADHYQGVRAVLSDGEEWDRIWGVDSVWRATNRALPMYTRTWWGEPVWDGTVEALNTGTHFRSERAFQGDLVVFHPRAISSVGGGYRASWPTYVMSPPATWRTEYVSRNGELAVMTPGAEPAITDLREPQGTRWQVLGLSGWTIDPSQIRTDGEFTRVDLQSRARAWLMDDQAPAYDAPNEPHELGPGYARGSVTLSSSAGGSIAGAVPAGTPGGHRIRLFCFLYGPDGRWNEVLAVAAPFPRETATVGFVCPRVGTEDPVVGVRIGIHSVGPAELSVGDLELWWEHSRE